MEEEGWSGSALDIPRGLMQDWPGDLPAPTLPGEEDRLCQTQIWGSQEGCLGLAAFDPKPQSSQGLFALQVQSLRRL